MNSIKDKIKKISKWFFGTKKRRIIFSLLFVLLIITPLSFYFWNKSAQADWWNSDWNYRRSITINSAQIPADLTNYPMLVSFTDSNLINKTQADGGDIIFIEENGNRLDHEIEKFDNTTGELVAWVKIPQLDGDNDSIIYMYYGNQTVDNQQRVEDVWDENYLSVQHFNESSTTLSSDSTRNNKNGTKSGFDGDELSSGGKVGPAYNLDGANDYIFIPDMRASDYDEITMSVWFKSDVNNNSEEMLIWGQSHPAGGTNWAAIFHSAGSDQYVWYVPNTGWADTETENMNWNYATMKLSSNNQWEFGFNGNSIGTYNDIANHANRDVSNFVVAGNGYWGYLDGLIDEVRISKVPRSNNWITTEYNNQNSPSTFISLGQEEHGSSPALYLPFDEGFGTTAHDETSNHNDGSIVGATWKDESNCKSGKCLEFDGSGDYVEINDNKSLDLSEEVTLEAWVKPQSITPNNQTIISKVETPTDPTKIYRSVGPSATGALATGTATNHLTIVGDRAVFAQALPDNVGVGDAIQYDDDDDGDIDTNDSIVFIKQRVTSYEFLVATASGGVPTSVNADTNWSLFRAYTSLANAERGVENTGIDSDLRNFDDWTAGGDATTDDVGKDIVASNQQWNITCYANGTTADASSVSVNGWTTGINSFIKIYTPVFNNEVGMSQRHNGKWADDKYKMEINAQSLISINSNYLRIDGLQIKDNLSNIVSNTSAINTLTSNPVYVSNNILWGNSINNGAYYGIVNSGGVTIFIWNNIIYGFNYNNAGRGIYIDGFNKTEKVYIFNNTVYGCYQGIYTNNDNSSDVVKNNLSYNNIIDYIANPTFNTTSTNNISKDGTSPNAGATDCGGHSCRNQTVSFISNTSGSEDFHLSPTDTVAKDSGADLSSDNIFPFNFDIDGQTRLRQDFGEAKWDVGADEARATQIYRSVAPSKTDALETGDGNAMTITGDIAVFAKAMPSQVGVGDVIQYDDDGDSDIDASDSLAFISGRVSSYEFLVTTASGGVPTQIINDNDWSLFRAYTSLANAESGTENTGIDSDLINFDSWTGGKDLVTSKEQWNIACYANGTTADTTAVVVDGWTTDVQSFVKIYTPVSENEAGASQRHQGRWSDDKYNLEVTGNRALELYRMVKVDGLQIKLTATSGGSYTIRSNNWTDNTTQVISNCIFQGVTMGYTDVYGFYLDRANANIYNNIFYDFNGGLAYGRNWNSAMKINDTINSIITAYNNTINNCGSEAIVQGSGNIIVLKNNIFQNCTDSLYTDGGGSFSASSDYNISDLASDAPSPSYRSGLATTVSFVDEGNEDFHISKTDTFARNVGADLSTDASLPINSDIDGEERETFDIGADEAVATKIYRSVGPNNTTALVTDDGHENNVVVSSGIVSFSANIPDKVGVGDAVIIDTGGTANTIDASDTLLFISKRISSTTYELQTHTGSAPTNITSNDTYQIFRAYTSLANAESGTKNTSIPMTFNGGNRDLVTNNEEWNIACYGDAIDTTVVNIEGWETGAENIIKIYTPVNSDEVGISQRHNGKWNDNSYQIVNSAALETIGVRESFVAIDGLQIYISNSGTAQRCINSFGGDFGLLQFSNNIMRGVSNNQYSFGIYSDAGNGSITKVWNNLIYDISDGTSVGSSGIRLYYGKTPISYLYAFNNTISGAHYGLFESGNEFIAVNNIVRNCTDGFFTSGSWSSSSNFNISDQATDAPGANSKNSTTVTFRDAANDDFRLAMNDTSAKGAGLNLSNDTNLPVTHDIEGEKRPSLVTSNQSSVVTGYGLPFTSYDVGADQISSTIHNNYSLNLKTNYPQTNFSTGDNDRDNFSSGDMNLGANTWSHIAYKRSNDIEELYINGSKKDSSTISNFLKTNNGKLYLGSDNTASKNSFKGLLDEIKIYPYARTESEIKKDKVAGSSGRAASRAQEGVGVAIGDKSSNLSDGLVGYWKMDETSWTGAVNEVKDASGNNNHGVRNGNATTGAGKFGNGGTFDGTGDYVNTNLLVNQDGNTSYSFSFWAKPTGACASGYCFAVASDSGDYEWSTIYSDDNNWHVYNGSGRVAQTAVKYNEWQHVTTVYDHTNDEYRFYFNGSFVKSGSITYDVGVNPLSFGEVYTGQIDETRIYNRALSADEVKQLYNYAPGPVLHLKMDEKSGTTAFDSSGFGNDGTITGATWETGKFNSATKFVNDTDNVFVSQSSSINNLKSFTYSAWVKSATTGVDSRRPIIEKGDGSDVKKTLYFGDHVGSSRRRVMLRVYTNGTTGELTTLNDTYSLDTWEYWTFTYDDYGTRIPRLYKNGIEVQNTSQVAATGVIDDDSTMDLALGSSPGSSFYSFDGMIDDVKIYNYVRTQEQILEDMGASAGASMTRGVALKSPILDLNFNEGQGATANDASGNGNNGTLNAGSAGKLTTTAMWTKAGKESGAINFDGTDDYVTPGNESFFDFEGTDAFSISTWIKRSSSDTEDAIVEKVDPSASWRGYSLWLPGEGGGEGCYNCIEVDVVNSWNSNLVVRSSDNIIKTGEWQNVIMNYDGSGDVTGLKIYVDGKLAPVGGIPSDTLSGSILNDNNLLIGTDRSDIVSGQFDGSIDEVKIYNYALGEDEIKTLYNGSSAMRMGDDETRSNFGMDVTGGSKEYCVPGDDALCNKPVLELSLNEKSGTTAKDTSGNGNNGTVSGATWDRGKINGGLNFNGGTSNTSGTFSGVSNFPFTMSVWTMATSGDNGSFRPAVNIGVDSDEYFGIGWGGTNGEPVMAARNTSFTDYVGSAQGTNKWTHLVGVFNSSTSRDLYIDGKYFGRQTTSVNFPTGSNIYQINRTLASGQYGFMKVDDVKIYNYARTPAQIAWDYNQGLPINNWTLDEGTGTTAHDLGEGKNHGTITGATWKDESECKNGKCLYFNGLDQTRVAADTQDNMTNFTACTWMKANALINNGSDPWMAIFSKGWSLRLYNNGRLRFENPTSGTYPYLVTQDALNANEWYRACGVYYGIGTIPKIYLNGVEQSASASDPGDGTHNNDSSSGLEVGSDTGGWADNFYGYIDDPKIYNYTLSEEQIKQDYNGGAVNFK